MVQIPRGAWGVVMDEIDTCMMAIYSTATYLYQEFPKKFFAETETQSRNSLKDADHIKFLRDNIQAPFLKEAAVSATAYGGNWLEFPKIFAAGADSRWNYLFWRSVLRSLNL